MSREANDIIIPTAEQLLGILDDTDAKIQAHQQAEELRRSTESMVLTAKHVVLPPEGYTFQLLTAGPRTVTTGSAYGDERALSGIRLSQYENQQIEADAEPFYAERLAVFQGTGKVALSRLYNFRAYDLSKGDIISLIETDQI